MTPANVRAVSFGDDESNGAAIVYRTAYRGEGDYRLVPVEGEK